MKTDDLPKIMHLNSNSASTDSDKAQLFNKFVYLKPLMSEQDSIDTSESLPQNSLEFITEEEVLTALSNLDPSKATGIDGIGPRLLRNCALPLCSSC